MYPIQDTQFDLVSAFEIWIILPWDTEIFFKAKGLNMFKIYKIDYCLNGSNYKNMEWRNLTGD